MPGTTVTLPSPTASVAAPTAAVGTTFGSSCESGKLRFADLTAMDAQWREGLDIARGRAMDWQSDAVLVELGVACELFEPGFRWQATYFSRIAQAYYATDTGEIAPVEVDPTTVKALFEADIRFGAIADLLATNGYVDDDVAVRLESIRLTTTTPENPVGPNSVPANHTVAHVRVSRHGNAEELYVDVTAGGIHRYGEE